MERYFNISKPDGYYLGEHDWQDEAIVDDKLLKPGTRGTVIEDNNLLPRTSIDDGGWIPWIIFPYLNHFWVPWRYNHKAWWEAEDSISYATRVFDEGVQLYADGAEGEAFESFGRVIHIMQDNGSIPHVFGDSHPGLLTDLTFTDKSGFERWCRDAEERTPGLLHGSDEIVEVTTLQGHMERLALETLRSVRIQGSLHRSLGSPVGGDLAQLFPGGTHLTYIPILPLPGGSETWHIEGVGENFFGDQPVGPDRQLVLASVPLPLENRWERVPNLSGEDGEYYYLEHNLDTVVPARIWSLREGAFVENVDHFPLAQLWAGVDGYRATPDQKHEIIPLAVSYTTGFMKYLWEFVNPPPFLARVEIRQATAGEAIRPGDDSQIVYRKGWREKYRDQSAKSTARELSGTDKPMTHQPVTVTLLFSEPVKDVNASLEDLSRHELARGLSSQRGPPTPTYPDGENIVTIPDVDLSALSTGRISLSVEANDLSPHVGEDGSRLDGHAGSRAGRLPDGSWTRYDSGPDGSHGFSLATFMVRITPPGRSVAPGQSVSHTVQVKNADLPPGQPALLRVYCYAPLWELSFPESSELAFPMPAPGTGWVTVGAAYSVKNPGNLPGGLTLDAEVTSGGETRTASVEDWSTTRPGNDRPDDTESVADARYPTPWLLDQDAPIGILAGGWGEGLGHLLGRYGIATALVAPRLTLPNNPGRDLRDLQVLLVGSGGFSGLEASASFREGIADYVAGGGVLLAMTAKLGRELAALPGGEVAGFGWTEDQACFGAAVSIVAPHPALSGQSASLLDVGADGYLTRWPEDATVLLRRTSNLQPAMIRYPYGRGEVFVLTLYPDWSYAGAQSSTAERNLVRDLVTYALARPAAIPEYLAGDAITLTPSVVNYGPTAATRAVFETREPDRTVSSVDPWEQPLAPYERQTALVSLTAPSALGLYPVTYTLEDGSGAIAQESKPAATFAVRAPLEVQAGTAPGLRIWVTVPGDHVPRGEAILATVHVANETAREFNGFLSASWVHYCEGPVAVVPGVVVPAYSEAVFPLEYPLPDMGSATIRYMLTAEAPAGCWDFYETALADAYKGFTTFCPVALLRITPPEDPIAPGVATPVTLTLSRSTLAPVRLDLTASLRDAENREVWSEQRAVSLSGEALWEGEFTLSAPTESASYLLQVEARSGSALVGRTAVSLPGARPRITFQPAWPSPWRAGEENDVPITLRNEGALAEGAGSFTLALRSPDGDTLLETTLPLPPLEPGESVELPLHLRVPLLPFGESSLAYSAQDGVHRNAAAASLPNKVDVEIDAAPGGARAGLPIEGRVVLRNRGVVVGSASLEIAVPALGILQHHELADTASRSIPFAADVPRDVGAGTYEISASLRMADTVTARASITVAPPKLAAHPPQEVPAGATYGLGVTNVGGASGDYEWTLRLLPCNVDPTDPAVPALGEAGGNARLAPGEDTVLHLPVPAGLPNGLYGVALSALELRSGYRHAEQFFVFVDGVALTLEASTDRPVYFPGEEVIARARVTNGVLPLAGGSLRLLVTGSGGIDPVHYDGSVHVSPEGDDLNADGTRERPFASIQAGIDAAPAGARVLLLAGVHPAHEVRLRDGTILQGEVLAGEPAAVVTGASLIGASNVTIDHLFLEGSQISFAVPVSHVRVSDNVIREVSWTRSAGQGVVFAQEASDVLIARNRFSRLLLNLPGVHFMGYAESVAVIGNEFADFPAGRYGGLHLWGSARDLLAQENVFRGITGSYAGISIWHYTGDARDLRFLNNRFSGLAGDECGIHLREATTAVEIRGNEFTDASGVTNGICAWDKLSSAVIADNSFRGLRGSYSGITLWGHVFTRMLDVRIENNLLDGIEPADSGGRSNGIQVWEGARHLTITGNHLRAVTGGDPAGAPSGIAFWDDGDALEISRNIVRGGPVGILLRPWSLTTTTHPLDAVVEHNLLLGNAVGIVEAGTTAAAPVAVRDNIVADSTRAGVLRISGVGDPEKVSFHHNDFFRNTVDFEGRPDPSPSDGNLASDPRFADPNAADFRLLPGSLCLDAGSEPLSDIGPYEDSRTTRLGPRPVADELLSVLHWTSTVPLDLDPLALVEISGPVSPLTATGPLTLVARVESAAGLTLAEQTARFTVNAGEFTLALAADRAAYRPGEAILVSGEISHPGGGFLADLQVVVSAGADRVYATTASLAPGETASFSFPLTASHSLVLHGEAGGAAFDLPIVVAEPEVVLRVQAPELVGDEAFTLSATLANTGAVPALLELDLAGEPHSLRLAPGEERAFTRSCQIAADTTFVVVLDGDVKDFAARSVVYGFIPTIALEGVPRYPVGPVLVPLLLGNAGTLGGPFTATATLRAGWGATVSERSFPVWLDGGGSVTKTIDLGDLAAGDFHLSATLAGKTAEMDFTVLEPVAVRVESVAIGEAPDAEGNLAVAVRLHNGGAAAWAGTLTLDTIAGTLTRPLALDPAADRAETLPLRVSGLAAGTYPLSVSLERGGVLEARLSAAVTLVSKLALTGLPLEHPIEPGTPATVSAVVSNAGSARGAFSLRLRSGDLVDRTEVAGVGAGEETRIDFSFPVPADLPPDGYRAVLTLTDLDGGLQEERELILRLERGIQVTTTVAFDRPAYRDGDTVHLVLSVRNDSAATAALRAVVAEGSYREWREIVLTPRPESTLDAGTEPGSLRLPAGALAGSFTSSVLDALAADDTVFSWDAATPAECSTVVEARFGVTSLPDASWSAWVAVPNGAPSPDATGRFLQYRVGLSCPSPAGAPTVANIAVDCRGSGRRFLHVTEEDFTTMPLRLAYDFPADFTLGDRVFTGIYTPSGRSLRLDAITIRRFAGPIACWTDRPRYVAGERMTLFAEVVEAGTVVVDGFGFRSTATLAGPATVSFLFDLPPSIASGTHFVTADFRGETTTVPIEVEGFDVRIDEAVLDRTGYLPGEEVTLEIDLHSSGTVAGVTVEAWVAGATASPLVLRATEELAAGVTRIRRQFLMPAGGPGTLECIVLVTKDAGLPGALRLAVARVSFDRLSANLPPVAAAGDDLVVEERVWVALDGAESLDPDEDRLRHRWAQTAGPLVTLYGANDARAVFLSPDMPREGGDLRFALRVDDGRGGLAEDEVTVRVTNVNREPVAGAGKDFTRGIGEVAELDGSSSFDPDGEPLAFTWSLVASPEGSNATLDDPTAIRPTLPIDRGGDYLVALTVSDGTAASQADTVRVSTVNSAPTADAGHDLTGRPGERVTADGSSSFDPDDDRLGFRWGFLELPEGSVAVLETADAAQTSFTLDVCGTYRLALTVADERFESDPDTVLVNCVNARPIADAGPDAAVRIGQRVKLDGRGSADPDGDRLGYHWSFLALPPGSAAALDSRDVQAPSFLPDLVGTYGLALVVDDGVIQSEADAVVVTAGTNIAGGTITILPSSLRPHKVPTALGVWIELQGGWSSREIVPAHAALTAVGKRTLRQPIACLALKGARITDRDRDGHPELAITFPVRPLLRYLRPGKNTLTFQGPLATGGSFLGTGTVTLAP